MIHLDLETRAVIDLTICGSHRYSLDCNTDVWCLCYHDTSTDTSGTWYPGDKVPDLFLDPFNQFTAWNAQFERNIHSNILVPRYGFEPIDVDQWEDTAAWSRQLGLPASLGKAGEVLGLPSDQKKDKDGRTLMMKMAKPRNYTATGEPIWWDDLEDHKMLDDLVDYCKQDVLAEIAISKMLTEVSKFTNRQTITYYARD